MPPATIKALRINFFEVTTRIENGTNFDKAQTSLDPGGR